MSLPNIAKVILRVQKSYFHKQNRKLIYCYFNFFAFKNRSAIYLVSQWLFYDWIFCNNVFSAFYMFYFFTFTYLFVKHYFKTNKTTHFLTILLLFKQYLSYLIHSRELSALSLITTNTIYSSNKHVTLKSFLEFQWTSFKNKKFVPW